MNFCSKNQIILCCFPPKLTHRLQPLDSKPFQAYKHYYKLENNRTKLWGGSVSSKRDFLRSIHQVRTKTFKELTVRHSFKHCGLWPFDPEVICKDLRPDVQDLVVYDRGKEYKLPEWDFSHSRPVGEGSIEGEEDLQDATPPPASSSTVNSPPKTIIKLREKITKARERFPDSPTADFLKLQRRLEAIFEGSLTQAEIAAQASAGLTRLFKNQEQANAPKSKRQVSKGGVLAVRDSNTMIRSRDIAEAEKQTRKWAREAKQKRDEWARQDQTREQENRRRERELSWVIGDDGQPLYTIDRQGMAL
jgi:hypothetical protein